MMLSAKPTGDVIVTPVVDRTYIISVVESSLTFTPSNWDTHQYFNLATIFGNYTGTTFVTFTASGAEYEGLW